MPRRWSMEATKAVLWSRVYPCSSQGDREEDDSRIKGGSFTQNVIQADLLERDFSDTYPTAVMKALTPWSFLSIFISLQVVNTAPILLSEALSSRDADIVGSEIHNFTWTPPAARNIVANELQPRRENRSKSGKKSKGGSSAQSNPADSNTGSPSGTDTSGGGGGLGPGGQDSG